MKDSRRNETRQNSMVAPGAAERNRNGWCRIWLPIKARKTVAFAGLLLSSTLFADTLGFVEQKFSDLNFDKGKWNRTVQLPCYTYTATEEGAVVEVLRLGTSNLVPFKAAKGLKVTVCGSTAAFDEGFEAGTPVPNRAGEKQH